MAPKNNLWNRSLFDLTLFISDEVFRKDQEFQISKNTQIGSIPYMGKEYNITLEMFIYNNTGGQRKSVIRFTNTTEDRGPFRGNTGDRIPVIQILTNVEQSETIQYVFVCSSVSNYSCNYDWSRGLVYGKWISLEISQTLIDNKVLRKFSK